MNRRFNSAEQAEFARDNDVDGLNSSIRVRWRPKAPTVDAKPTRTLLERVLVPMLVAAAAFLGVLMCVATYEFGTSSNPVPYAISNWVTLLAACILIVLAVLAIFSDSNAP